MDEQVIQDLYNRAVSLGYKKSKKSNKQINIEKTENITKFSSAFIKIVGIGLLGTTIIGSVTTFGSLIAITSVFTLLGLWLISKIIRIRRWHKYQNY